MPCRIRRIAGEGISVQGHSGLFPALATQFGGLRTIGKTGEEALNLMQDLRRLEEAGAYCVEVECATTYSNDYCVRTSSKIEITAQWKITQRYDGTFAMVNCSYGNYLSVKKQTSEVDLGWNKDDYTVQ